MAFGDPYATPEQLEQRLGQPDDGTFARLLDAASDAVEHFTRRQFNRGDDADEYDLIPRRFRALDCQRVAVDDFHTIEGLEVVVNGVPWDVATHIDARPWDGVLDGQVGWPFSDLFAISRSFPWSRRALITVTAHWGWAAVPAAIVEATLDNAEAMYLRRSASQSGLIRSETIDNYSISFFPNVSTDAAVPTEMLKALPFRRRNIFGVA